MSGSEGKGLPSTEEIIARYRARRQAGAEAPDGPGAEHGDPHAWGPADAQEAPRGNGTGNGLGQRSDVPPAGRADRSAGGPATDPAGTATDPADKATAERADGVAGGRAGRPASVVPPEQGPLRAERTSPLERRGPPLIATGGPAEGAVAAGDAVGDAVGTEARGEAEDEAVAPDAASGQAAADASTMRLGLGNPLFGAEERLAKHPFVAPRRLPVLLPLGIVLVALAAALDAAASMGLGSAGHLQRVDEAVGLEAGSFLAAGLGAAALLLGLLGRRRPRLALDLPAEQAQYWVRVQDLARSQRLMGAMAQVMLLLGIVIGWFAATRAPAPFRQSVVALAVLLAVAGLSFAIVAFARRRVLRELYAQTWLLAWLEQAGLAGPDEQVHRVLLAIDGLLGGLPEEHVQAFLASPVSAEYAALVDQAREALR